MSEIGDEKMSVDHDSDSKMSDVREGKSDNKNETLNNLKDLMEFYFSDSNLSKDRFLKQQIEASQFDGCKKIVIFCYFLFGIKF